MISDTCVSKDLKKIYKGPADATVLIIPKSVMVFEKDAIEHMKRLQVLQFNESVGQKYFWGAEQDSLKLPPRVKKIYHNVKMNDKSHTILVIPDGKKTIGKNDFTKG